MAKIINNKTSTFTLPSGHHLARLQTIEVTNAVLDFLDNVPTLNGLVAAGDITIERDLDEEPVVEVKATAKTKSPAEPLKG